jgi:hypothetical protein
LEPQTYNRSWLDPAGYDPVEVERDLQRMKGLGLNMVSFQMGDRRGLRNLLDFLSRCGRQGILVNGFLEGASPIAFDMSRVAKYLQEGQLAKNPILFAYDIIWEPGNWMFNEEGRKRWAPDWEDWIVNRYGDLASAEADWGMAVPRSGGKIAPPSDRHLREDGPWRVMVAAYRRFMDDLVSRKWNDATTRLRRLDPNHLISFHQGNTLPHDFAHSGPCKHIDFITLEGYSVRTGTTRLAS